MRPSPPPALPPAICALVRFSPPHVLGRRLRSNQAAVTMLAVDEQEEVETSACIMFEGRRVCGSARLQEDGMTCVWNGQRWVCVDL